MDKSRLIEIVKNFGKARVAVLGDFCLDLLFYGKHKGFSRESAAPINRVHNQIGYPGAAANVVYNLTKLGVAEVIPIGVIGTDAKSMINYGDILLNFFKEANIDTRHVLRTEGRETYAYMKFMATGEGTSTPEQQYYRADTGSDFLITKDLEQTLESILGELGFNGRFDALIISDYSKGVVTDGILDYVKGFAEDGRIVVGTARKDPRRLEGLTLIAQNDFETVSPYERELDESGRVDDEKLKLYGARLLEDTGSEKLVISRGAYGMSIIEHYNFINVPTKKRKVVDITGAGDSALATITSALAIGATLEEAAKIGNYAGGIVVQKPGTATASQEEILKEIENDE